MMKRFKVAMIAGAALAVAVPASWAVAQAPEVPGKASVEGIAAGVYTMDSAHTQVVAKVMHFGFNPYYILFGEAEGSLNLNPAELSKSSVAVTVPVSSVRTNSDGLTKHLLSADFFDVEKHPALTFKSKKLVSTGATTADVQGDLTIKGVTQPATLKVNFVGQGNNPMSKFPTVGFTATTTIKRSAFGVDFVLPLVSDEVELTITTAFELKK